MSTAIRDEAKDSIVFAALTSFSLHFALHLIQLFISPQPAHFLHQLKVHRVSTLHPDHMSAVERLGEIAEILATGLTRLRARQSSALPADSGESSLHCAAPQSG